MTVTLNALASRSYSEVTTDLISSSAGISKSSIYRRWGTREDLLIAALSQIPELTVPTEGDLKERLFGVVHQFVKLMEQTPLGIALPVLSAERLRNPKLGKALDELLKQRNRPILRVLEMCVEENLLSPTLKLEVAANMIIAPVIIQLTMNARILDSDDIRLIIDYALYGLAQY